MNFKRVPTEGEILRKTFRDTVRPKKFAVRGNPLFRRSRKSLNMLFTYVKAECHHTCTFVKLLKPCTFIHKGTAEQ